MTAFPCADLSKINSLRDTKAAPLDQEVFVRKDSVIKAEARRTVAEFTDRCNVRRGQTASAMLPPGRYEALLAQRAKTGADDQEAA